MKWRIVLTVLFVLTLFAGFAYIYVNKFVREHQPAVILFVVNGLDLMTGYSGEPLDEIVHAGTVLEIF